MNPARPRLDEAMRERLLEIWERTGDEGLRHVAEGRAYRPCAEGEDARVPNAEELLDWARTGLMNAFRLTGDSGAFDLLHDLTRDSFLAAIRGRLRGQPYHVDAHDVLQEVFLNIYRYPHRFLPDRADAFRNWGHRIVRNTLLKSLKRAGRRAQLTQLADEFGDQPDVTARSPFRSAADAESAQVADRAFLLWLNLYLLHFQKLSAREQRALRLVECDGRSYKDTADELGIRLENLKMVVFRGRRKILRGMNRSLGKLREHFEQAAADAARSIPSAPRHAKPSREPRAGERALRVDGVLAAGRATRTDGVPPPARSPRAVVAPPSRVPAPAAPLPDPSLQ